jgi:tetratricopeptide (TPR) repeat protein
MKDHFGVLMSDHLDQAMVHHRQGRLNQAAAGYQGIVDVEPAEPQAGVAIAHLALIHERRNQLDRAWATAIRGIEHPYPHPNASLVAARVARKAGRFMQAKAFLLALPPSQATPEILNELARIFDRLGEYAAAFALFGAVNQRLAQGAVPAKRALLPQMIAQLHGLVERAAARPWRPVPPDERGTPLFLVGFNRSGTTLLDVILRAHSQIQVLDEVPAIDAVRRRLGARYPHGLGELTQRDVTELRRVYFEVADKHAPNRQPGCLLVDKLPLNSIEMGLIHRLFPSARFVLSLRHPADVCLSNFMQAYQPNAVTCHFDSLEGTAKLYTAVMGLVGQYRRVLPIQVMEVRYEDLVYDWEQEVRRLLGFCGLCWEPQMTRYREQTTSDVTISTPSYHQVAEPIYQRSVGRCTSYALQLAPVMPALFPWITAYGYGEMAAR